MRVPTSTYRVQLTPDFGLTEAQGIIDYLEALGVSDLYTSPIFHSRPGSPHGYDVIDPRTIDPELGGEEAFHELADALYAEEMGLLCDIVPNHMAAASENPWWSDVLQRGTLSEFASFFDIDWDAHDGRVILPVLDSSYWEALEGGDLQIEKEGRNRFVSYDDQRFPLSPSTTRRMKRQRTSLRKLNNPKTTADLDELDRILAEQSYRLSYWRSGTRELNYRRFFDVADLVSVRVEDPDVFEATHALILKLVRQRTVTGIRVDHIDGLWDPGEYLKRLHAELPSDRSYIVVEKILAPGETLPSDWPAAGTVGYEFLNTMGGLFVDPKGAERLRTLAEEHTGSDETFPEIAREKKRQVLRTLFAGEVERLAAKLYELAGNSRRGRDLARADLEAAIVEVSACLPVYRTYLTAEEARAEDLVALERALETARGELPGFQVPALEFFARVLRGDEITQRWSGPRRLPAGERSESEDRWLDIVMRWQQLTGPAMAKGFEDTALYCHPVLTSRNEVGGDPGNPAVDVDAFHELNRMRLDRSPGSLNTTSTHDTKRSEDTRARIDALTLVPDEWERLVGSWREQNASHTTEVEGIRAPDAIDELIFYQSVVGIWPIDGDEKGLEDRLCGYMRKAAREAKRYTSWHDPHDAYEKALDGFVRGVLGLKRFRTDVERLVGKIAVHAATASLGQTVLKIASPGVPDVYQGCELWNFRLVDPDNRAPVDFSRRRKLLDALLKQADDDLTATARDVRDSWQDGRVKLFCTARALRFRREHADLFARGAYEPVRATGEHADRVVAFIRRRSDTWALAAVPRFTQDLTTPSKLPTGTPAWGKSSLKLPKDAPARWRNVLTAENLTSKGAAKSRTVRLSAAFKTLPVGLWVSGEPEEG